MLPDAHISHQTSQRLRVKIPSKKGEVAYFLSLEDQLSKCPGVENLVANPLTGSLLITHATDIKRIAEYAEANNLFQLGRLSPSPINLSEAISGKLKDLEQQMKQATGGTIDFPGLVFLGLISAGLFQLIRGNLTPIPWYTAFWYGFSVYEFFKHKSSKDKKVE